MTTLTKEMTEKFDKMARKIAQRYHRRCWWMPEEDLYQEAWIAGMASLKSFDPEYGTRLEAYAWCAMKRWLRGFLWRNSAPVSVPWGNMTAAGGLTRAPVEKAERTPSPDDPETRVVEADRAEKLRVALGRVGLPALQERPWARRRAKKSYALYRLWKEG